MKLFNIHIRRKELNLHVIFWLGWIVSFTVIQSIGRGAHQYFEWLMYYIITLPIFVAHTYLIVYWLLPQTFFKGKYFFTVAGLFLFLAVFSVIELVVSNEIVFRFFAPEKMFKPGYLNPANIIISGIGNHYIILIFLAIKVGLSWYRSENVNEELLQTKTETELEIFRYQLQPKLILSLVEELDIIMEKDSEKAPDMIIRISNFLNSFLYDGKDELISLQLESKLMEEYLNIHKHALGNRLVSNFIVSGRLQTYLVPPLLLLPFINTAIKIAYLCNDSFENTVLIKAEKKYLLYSFNFWSENAFRITENEDTEITRKRLKYGFEGKYRLIENIDENFIEYSLEIFN